MANPTLLADLATRLAKSPEDVATEALTLILGRSEAARQAVNSLIAEWSQSSLCSVRRWRAQVVGADAARTDMEGEDTSGVVRVIFENKFWAGLTPNQPSTYLKRLPAENGMLVFVVPTLRLSVLALELVERAARADFGRVEFSGGATRVAKVSSSQTLVVTSWEAILSTMASALEAAQDLTCLADLRQLQGLSEKMDTEAFLPLTATDLTGSTPRRILQLCSIVDEVYSLFTKLPFVSTKGLRLTAGAGWYGPYLAVHGFGCQFILSCERWNKFGISPLWFQIAAPISTLPRGLDAAIANTLPERALLKTEDKGSRRRFWLPIWLTEGRERDVVVADIMSQLEQVANVLGAHTEPASVGGAPAILPTDLGQG